MAKMDRWLFRKMGLTSHISGYMNRDLAIVDALKLLVCPRFKQSTLKIDEIFAKIAPFYKFITAKAQILSGP